MSGSNFPKLTVSHVFSRVKTPGLTSRGLTVFTDMSAAVAIFRTPPVSMATLKQDVDNLTGSSAAAMDGSKKDIARRNKDRRTLEQDLTLLGAYAVKVADGDPEILAQSGFVVAPPRAKSAALPVDQPSVTAVKQGKTGEMDVLITPKSRAASYDIRFAALVNGTPASWVIVATTVANKPVTVTGLTPGVVYAFQVRALGKLGPTDWSDSATRMCI
jgi:hypothetical protein